MKIMTESEQNRLLKHLESRFGISEKIFSKFIFLSQGNSSFLISNDKKAEIKKIISQNAETIKSAGIELFSDNKRFIPCSLGFCTFDFKDIMQNFVVIERQQAKDYFEGTTIDVKKIIDNHKNLLSDGYIIAIYNETIIGTLLFEKKQGKLIPNIVYKNKNVK